MICSAERNAVVGSGRERDGRQAEAVAQEREVEGPANAVDVLGPAEVGADRERQLRRDGAHHERDVGLEPRPRAGDAFALHERDGVRLLREGLAELERSGEEPAGVVGDDRLEERPHHPDLGEDEGEPYIRRLA